MSEEIRYVDTINNLRDLPQAGDYYYIGSRTVIIDRVDYHIVDSISEIPNEGE